MERGLYFVLTTSTASFFSPLQNVLCVWCVNLHVSYLSSLDSVFWPSLTSISTESKTVYGVFNLRIILNFVFTGLFYLFSWPSLTSDSTESKTPAALSPMIRSILRLWCHESSRTYSDRLFTEEQRYWYSSLLHDSVEEFFCGDNTEQRSEMFSVEQVEMEQKNLRGKWTF